VAVPALNLGPAGATQVASPVMQETRWNMLRAKRKAAQLRGLLNRSNLGATGFGGLLGGMGMNDRR